MTKPPDPPSPALKSDSAREQRLAQALRTNLKRRKAQTRASTAPTQAEERDEAR